MNAASVSGALAVAEYFVHVYTYARQTGDLTEWNALSTDDCGFCNVVVESVIEVAESNHSIRGGTVDVLDSIGSEVVSGEVYAVTLRVQEAPAQEVDGSGTVVASGSGAASDLLFALTWRRGWSVAAIDVTPTPTR